MRNQSNPLMTMVTGGTRSGKSGFAENFVSEYKKVLYIATGMYKNDDDFQERIREHQERRPTDWITWEEGYNFSSNIPQKAMDMDAILIDCLSTWCSNLLLRYQESDWKEPACWKHTEAACLEQMMNGLRSLQTLQIPIIMVTAEVGLGVIPPTTLGRRFQDLMGKANQKVASLSDQVFWVVSGIPVRIK